MPVASRTAVVAVVFIVVVMQEPIRGADFPGDITEAVSSVLKQFAEVRDPNIGRVSYGHGERGRGLDWDVRDHGAR